MVRTGHFHCHGLGSIPDWGTKIPQAAWHRQREEKIDNQNNHLDLTGIYRTLHPTTANRHSSQVYKVCSPTKTIKRVSVNLKGPKTYKICPLITVDLIRSQYYKIPRGKKKYLKMKQYTLNNPGSTEHSQGKLENISK